MSSARTAQTTLVLSILAGIAIVGVAWLALTYPAVLLWWGALSLLVTPLVLALFAGVPRDDA